MSSRRAVSPVVAIGTVTLLCLVGGLATWVSIGPGFGAPDSQPERHNRPGTEQLDAFLQTITPVVESTEESLEEFGRRYEVLPDEIPTGAEREEQSRDLELYLSLTGPKAPEEPGPAGHTRAHELLAARLVEAGGAVADPALITTLLSSPDRLLERDPHVVERARNALTRLSRPDAAVELLIHQCAGPDLTLVHLIGADAQLIHSDGVVRCAFTRGGFDQVARALDRPVLPPQWVLGQSRLTEDQEHEEQARIRDLYLRNYVMEWRDLLRSVRVDRAPPHGRRARRGRPEVFIELSAYLADLTRGDEPPLERLLRATGHHTQLRLPDGLTSASGWTPLDRTDGRGLWDRDREHLTIAHVTWLFHGFVSLLRERPGEPREIDVYHHHLRALHTIAVRRQTSGARPEDRVAAEDARAEVRAIIDRGASGWRPRHEALFWPAIDSSGDVLAR